MNFVTRKKKTEEEMKEALGLKLLELVKTTTKKAVMICSTSMLSLLVMTKPLTLAGLPFKGSNAKTHHYHYHHKGQKMKDLSKRWVFTGKRFEDFRQKKNSNIFFDVSKSLEEHKDLQVFNCFGPV